MQNDKKTVSNTRDPYKFYEPLHFDQSPFFRSWVKMFIADVLRLKEIEGYEGTGTKFWKNHPIRWVEIVGIVVAITIKASKGEIEVDDGSGAVICLTIIGDVAESVHMDFEHNTCALVVSDLVKIKGILSSNYRGEIQILPTSLESIRDRLYEIKAWEDRVSIRQQLDVPWVLSEVAQSSAGTEKTSKKNVNTAAKLKEVEKMSKRFVLGDFDSRHHTQRNLRMVLLQYFKEHNTRDFTVAQLRQVPELVEAITLVSVQAINAQRELVSQKVSAAEHVVSSSQKYRTLNSCISDLVRDGSIMAASVEEGRYSVVGRWNLGVAMEQLMAKKFAANPDLDHVPVKELWQDLRSCVGYESISKQMVQNMMDAMLSE